MALNQSASVQRNLLGRLGDPAAAGFKVRNATDMALMLADESYIVATLNIVQERLRPTRSMEESAGLLR